MLRSAIGVGALGLVLVPSGWAGHEVPFYPSFYPQEIKIEPMPPGAAKEAFRRREPLHAYAGSDPFGGRTPPATVSHVTSLRGWLVATFNPTSRRLTDAAGRCAVAARLGPAVTTVPGVAAHPYPVTPWHADYLEHFDLIEAAKDHDRAEPPGPRARVKAEGPVAQALHAAGWTIAGRDWDVGVEEVPVERMTSVSQPDVSRMPGPPAMKAGWYQTYLLVAPAIADAEARRAIDDLVQRRLGSPEATAERVSLERRLVSDLRARCERAVLGYTVRREPVNVEYSEGIENVGYDDQRGVDSAMFVRTAKLKDFPWNGWMRVGVEGPAASAWNPVGGFGDPVGRLLWQAVGDSALLPAPYGAGWLPNRVLATVSREGAVPADARAVDPESGALTPVSPGTTAGTKVAYKVLASAAHDATKLGVADAVAALVFAARWHPRETARAGLVGFKVVRVGKELKDLGDIKLFFDVPEVDVYLRGLVDEALAPAVAPPWSPLPWHVAALMDAAVSRGLAAFTEADARRRHVAWLDLARDPKTGQALAGLAARFEAEGWVPEALRSLVTAAEARQRWAALREFYRAHRHFLVTAGPYQLQTWSMRAVVLTVFRDLSYPVALGTFDPWAVALRAFVVGVERRGERLLIAAEVERATKVERSTRRSREAFRPPPAGEQPRDTLVARWMAVGAGGAVAAVGASSRLEDARVVIDLKNQLRSGEYRILVALVSNGNHDDPEVKIVPYVVPAR